MKRWAMGIALAALLGHAPAGEAAKASKASAPPARVAPGQERASAAPSAEDSAYTLKGGQEGTVFRSLTVQGEDRIRFDIARPPLRVELDPARAPGLDWGSAREVLDRTVPDLAAPLVRRSADEPSLYVAHPWLAHFASGAVARFRPDLRGVERWKLTIVNARGEAVATYQGRGEPPREIAWDGRSQAGAPVVPGLTYSYVLEAHDRAGNRRNFVGQGFQVSAYRLETADGPLLVFSGRELPSHDPRRASGESGTAPILLEAATWLNQRPSSAKGIRIAASARHAEEAQALGATVARQLAPHLLGDPALIRVAAEVRPDAPEGGTVQIAGMR